ncbi:MAG: UDP-N-acetylmuramoyl-L-alanine--D-glutamate ligase [Myxococcales bacterium]|nr:MAG: UDP-N-acetylmuramoyl-L-alanine--D-glutamate ligase [Myxococcales bacterium]
MALAGRTVIVVGLARSGVAAARACLARGARVVGNDAAPRERLSEAARALEAAGVTLITGGHGGVDWASAAAVVVSPGVPPLAVWSELAAAGVPVLGELDLGWQLLDPAPPTVCIGGTNGKSTTTTLVGAMLEAAGLTPFVGGNLGTPLAEVVPAPGEPFAHGSLVLEVSSFQSERMPALRPRAAALLNITADHLDRYTGLDDYAAAKGNLLVQMGPGDTVVIPDDDALCRAQARRAGAGAAVVTFGVSGDVRVTADAIVDTRCGHVYPRQAIQLQGEHNARNAAAAVALAAGLGLDREPIAHALATFAGLAHRIALVTTLDGVRYYDDSKGTNVGASVAALRGLAEPRAVLIAGGRDKLGDYAPLVEALRDRGRALVLIGEAAGRIAAAVGDAVETRHAASIEEAVALARSLARPGDAVLLSPACSSFDMFRDYRERGDRFVAAARALASSSAKNRPDGL